MALGVISVCASSPIVDDANVKGIPVRTLLGLGVDTALLSVAGTLGATTAFAPLAFILVFGRVNLFALWEAGRDAINPLVSTPESEKRRFPTTAPACRLVVYEEAPPVYRSVLAGGRLDVVERDDLDSEHIAQYGRAKRPLFEIWAEPTADLEVQLFRLEPADISGRRIDGEQGDR